MAKREPEVNLRAVKTFYNPHPGGGFGAVAPLPPAVKQAVDELDGKRMSIKKAVERIQSVTRGLVDTREVIGGAGWITVKVRAGRIYPTHCWVVIFYR